MPRCPRHPILLAVLALAAWSPAAAGAADISAQIVVSPQPGASTSAVRAAAAASGTRVVRDASRGRVVLAASGEHGVSHALAALRARRAISSAVPRLVARIADDTSPNDTGLASRAASARGGWRAAEWDLTGPFGVGAPEAWSLARGTGHAPGAGVTVAVLDTGLAYSDRPPFRRSPDIAPASVIPGRDFVDGDNYPNDRNGHGTFVTSTVVAAADNSYGMVGIAYAARVMPVRVLDGDGYGTAARVARGMRWAVDHGADVLNVSIELFDPLADAAESMTSSPAIRGAVRYAAAHRVPVVAAAGNSASPDVPSTRLGSDIIYVGASTEHGCVASYSNFGHGTDLVAPGGGADAAISGMSNCRPSEPQGRNVLQVTFQRQHLGSFGVQDDGEGRLGRAGTSMAAPHVSAIVALLLGSGVLGSNPTPQTIQQRLTRTSRVLGGPGSARYVGAGLVDAPAALRGIRAPTSSG
jgi:serine protease